MQDIGALLIDLDGTVYTGSRLLPGAGEAVRTLREREVPFLFTTNTSRKSRQDVVSALARMGLEAEEREILTAPVAGAHRLRAEGVRRVQLLVPRSTWADFAEFEIDDREPEAVLVGDLGAGFTFERLNSAFRSLRDGARLVAIHKNRWWLPETGPTLDAGPFVAALEYAADVDAELVGKPSPAFFRAAAAMLGVPEAGLAVVGDDLESDVRGARAAGLHAILVRTGKYDPEALESAAPDARPHQVVADLGAVPEMVG